MGVPPPPPGSGLRTGWVTNREYRLKGPYVILSFLLLLFCVLRGLIVNRFSIISASGFKKDKNKEQISVRLKIIIVRAVIQSRNVADFDVHISAGKDFQQ